MEVLFTGILHTFGNNNITLYVSLTVSVVLEFRLAMGILYGFGRDIEGCTGNGNVIWFCN